MSKNISCGIDFGTSNSAIAINQDRHIDLIRPEADKMTIPSAMFFVGQQHDAYFGRAAIEMFLAGEEGRFMRSLKRVLGTSIMNQGTLVNGRSMKFDQIIGRFIKNLKDNAESAVQDTLENVVMGRPVHFVDGETDADKRAQDELEAIAKAIGFKNIEFQFEPIAAAYAHEVNLTSEKLALIVDIGGGTSDFTVIRLSNQSLMKADRSGDILSNSGVRIGGNDLDKALSLQSFMPELGYKTSYGEKNLDAPLKPFHDLSEWSKVNFLYTHKTLRQMRQILLESHDKQRLKKMLTVLEDETGHMLLQEIEHTKIALTDHQEIKANLDFIDNDLHVHIMREAFEKAIKESVSKVSSTALECVSLASLKSEEINLIVLTGGSTEIPLIQQIFKSLFPHADISEENKLSSVATGLAYDSIRKFGG